MKILNLLFFAGSLLVSAVALADSKPVIMLTPPEYQILCVSPNGKWACGDYNDYSQVNHGFRMNLESGKVELLDTTNPCIAWGITNDGVVSGTFTDTKLVANQIPVSIPGYWDGEWHAVELPIGATPSGVGYAISRDGHYVSGSVIINGIYKAYIWKDGKIFKSLVSNSHAMPFTISPDGQSAAGWAQGSKNRVSAYWKADGTCDFLSPQVQSPFVCGKKFSDDGKKLLFWGGWDMEAEDDILRAVLDLETNDTLKIPCVSNGDNFDIFDISNDGKIVGQQGDRAYIYADGKPQYVYDYLKARGVNLDTLNIIVPDGDTYPYIYRSACISPDGNVITMECYDTDRNMRTVVVKMNQEVTHCAPCDVKVKKMPALNTVKITWSPNFGVEGAKGYNVYRDGKRLNKAPLAEPSYYDDALVNVNETYKYTVATICSDGIEAVSSPVSFTVERDALAKPVSFFARQKGGSGAFLQWEKPISNNPVFSYADYDSMKKQGFGVTEDNTSFEMAIAIDKGDMACYTDFMLTKVAFFPMSEQNGWKLNVYTRDEEGKLNKVYSQDITQPLTYMERNTVVLDRPLRIAAAETMIAIEAKVATASGNVIGVDYGRTVEGYGDLLRREGESDFYSLCTASTEQGYPTYCTWLIDAVLESQFKSGETDPDLVNGYQVVVDGQSAGTTNGCSYDLRSLSVGEHSVGVKALYANGTESDASLVPLAITNRFPGVDSLSVFAVGESAIHVEWNTPVDKDRTWISYASDVPATNKNTGLKGPSDNNYGFMAAIDCTSSMLRGYEGYLIKSFKFYPTTDATFTIFLYEDNEQVAEVEVDDYVLNQWNEVKLPQPIAVKKNADYMMAIDCYDVTPKESPLAIDGQPSYNFMSDLYSVDEDGESWSSITDSGLSGNWMMGFVIESPKEEAVAVTGYDVMVDGKKSNAGMLTDTKFDYDFDKEDQWKHTVSVNTYYPNLEKSVSGETHYFYIGSTGIADATCGNVFNLYQSNNILKIEGGNVSSVDIYAADGKVALSASESTVSLDSLTPGVYVVKVKADGKSMVRKMEIRR